jgi:small subunit ribosomal protein S6
MYIVRPDADDEKLAATVARVNGLITDRGGLITKETAWGRKRLAYPIQDFREGLYQIVQFNLDPSHAATIDRQLRLTEDIIRHQVIRPGQ